MHKHCTYLQKAGRDGTVRYSSSSRIRVVKCTAAPVSGRVPCPTTVRLRASGRHLSLVSAAYGRDPAASDRSPVAVSPGTPTPTLSFLSCLVRPFCASHLPLRLRPPHPVASVDPLAQLRRPSAAAFLPRIDPSRIKLLLQSLLLGFTATTTTSTRCRYID